MPVDHPHPVLAVRVVIVCRLLSPAGGDAASSAGVAIAAGHALVHQGFALAEQEGVALGLDHLMLPGDRLQLGELGLGPGQFVAASQTAVGVEGEDVIALEVGEVAEAGAQTS